MLDQRVNDNYDRKIGCSIGFAVDWRDDDDIGDQIEMVLQELDVSMDAHQLTPGYLHPPYYLDLEISKEGKVHSTVDSMGTLPEMVAYECDAGKSEWN